MGNARGVKAEIREEIWLGSEDGLEEEGEGGRWLRMTGRGWEER